MNNFLGKRQGRGLDEDRTRKTENGTSRRTRDARLRGCVWWDEGGILQGIKKN